ncbi:MAG TPA: alpha/beta hydrolase, partial [Actinomycetota bacterium]|nr:alpha/beta hydrolase [Actinomycetota bacterium]
MRARYPDRDGYVERDGVKVFYEAFGVGEPTVLLLPTWSIIHSRHWKDQIPYLARHFRVVTFDGRGNGRSDRPSDAAAYSDTEFVADAIDVLDATGTDRAVIAGVSMGSGYALRLAAEHPDRVLGAVFVGPSVGLSDPIPDRITYPFDEVLPTDEGWAKYNEHYWRRDWGGFAEFFFSQVFTEPHSTKPIEDCVGWALETDADTILTAERAPYLEAPAGHRRRLRPFTLDLARQVRCPCLVIHGSGDAISHVSGGIRLAESVAGDLAVLEGSGHCPQVRDPVAVNLLMRDFVRRVAPERRRPSTRSWTRARVRPPKALYLSSPIGLGHALRDVAIAEELRRLHPGLQIDWLAQHPVTKVLEARDERVHPASAWLANESEHIEAESAEHDLHAFQAIRRMDEILIANFMVLHDVLESEPYDLVVGDESWDVDHFLHENPELKRTRFVWMTDFVGWLPMPDGGEREAFLTADYNAEMIGQVERYPRIRDRAIFVGDPDDIVPDAFGPDLPSIREWTESHYDFAGYVTGFDPAALSDTGAIRGELGYRPDEKVCIVTVGGSGVGGSLLRRVIAAYPQAKREVPALR